MRSHDIDGSGGVALHVDETGIGNDRSVVFVHGFSQSRLSWDRQLHSGLAGDLHLVAFDLRGHGRSEKPRDAYHDTERWADDVRAVIDALGLERPILVGWSYGGVVVSDYLSVYGGDGVAGVVLVGAATTLGTDAALATIGEDFLELASGFASTDAEESVRTLETFLDRCTYEKLSPQDARYMLGFNVVVPPHVRSALLGREVDHDAVLSGLDVPVRLVHGEEDRVALPAASERHERLIPDAELSWYPEVGHAPFWESPEQFNRELLEFADAVSS